MGVQIWVWVPVRVLVLVLVATLPCARGLDLHVPERARPGRVLADLSLGPGWTHRASDPDRGEAGRLQYAMEALFDRRSDHLFAIDAQTGSVTTRSEYRVSIRENVEAGFEVMTIRATDGDAPSNANMVYRLVNEDELDGAFEIDRRSGLVRVRRRPDRESRAEYALLVEADDQGGDPGPRTATAAVHVTVEDENDNYPQFSEKRYVARVREDAAVNSRVAKVEASDRDEGANARVHYSIISGNVRGQFYIHSPTGAIDLINPLDHENIREYSLRIKAQDGGRPPLINATGLVVVQVMDVNDNAPMFVSTPFQASVLENYRLTGTAPDFPLAINNSTGWVTVTRELDREAADFFSFGVEARDHGSPSMASAASISGGNTRNRFAISSHGNGGLLTLALPLDYKQERQYALTLTASDGERADAAQVFINVTDANTHRPVFQSANYQFTLIEGRPAGHNVAVISATDEDTGENARITYLMEDGAPQFRIDPDTGAITTTMEIDYEEQASYTLAVEARDNGIPQKSDTTYVEIIVLDANDNAPAFRADAYQVLFNNYVTNKSNSFPSGVIGRVPARDPDVSDRLRFRFEAGNELLLLLLDPDSGELRLSRDLDNDRALEAPMTISVTGRDPPGYPPSEGGFGDAL
ncbi:unnamed protein product [Menidia menidia]|uniref:(Atlantic silverside) hypothetical protein n=1 Tax=Menidia menidia TaxID=238744 RepID=A0A8S4B8G9_9TELE|nr:unnamed protein product [Menidia menidia]